MGEQLVIDFSEPEQWRPIPGQPGYEASDLGNIRGLPRTIAGTKRHYPLRILKPTLAKNGYFVLNLGHSNLQLVHRLVCAAFHGVAPPERREVAHWDGDKLNNRPQNLRWATGRENSEDRRRHGRTVFGEASPNVRISDQIAKEIKALIANGVSQAEIARIHAINPWIVWDIAQGKTWTHV